MAYLIPEPLAAALGADMPIHTPTGNMIVNIGGGVSEAAVISLYGIVVSNSVRVGGDQDGRSHRRLHPAQVQPADRRPDGGARSRFSIGSALPLEEELTMEVRGRDQVAGLPRTITITSAEVTEALAEPLAAIAGDGQGSAGKDTARIGLGHHRSRHRHDRRRVLLRNIDSLLDRGDRRALPCGRERDALYGPGGRARARAPAPTPTSPGKHLSSECLEPGGWALPARRFAAAHPSGHCRPVPGQGADLGGRRSKARPCSWSPGWVGGSTGIGRRHASMAKCCSRSVETSLPSLNWATCWTTPCNPSCKPGAPRWQVCDPSTR